MALSIELWGPPLGALTGGNLYDRLLVEALSDRGHEVRVREFTGALGTPPPESAGADLILQDELLHREFRAGNALWKKRRPRIAALVHHLQSSEPERGEAARRRLAGEERDYLGTVDAIVAPSRASLDAARRLAIGDLPGAVVAPGRDRFAGGALPPLPGPREIEARGAGPLRAAFVGNLIPRKRLLELLEAVAAIPEWTLEIAGREDADADYADRVRRRAAASGLAGRVTLHGALGPGALAALLRRSCLLAVPSTHEGFGIVYLEGFAFGLPALAAGAGGASEIVSDGETGWRIRESEPGRAATRIAGCLRSLAADRGMLARMGLAAARRWRLQPTWRESAAGVERLFTGAGVG